MVLVFLSEFGEKLLEHVHSQNFGFTLDIKQAAQSGVGALKYLPIMAERLKNVHICDFVHTESGMQTCLPFRGEMNFAALRQGLLEANYEGPVMLEVYQHDYESEEELFCCYQSVADFFLLPRSLRLVLFEHFRCPCVVRIFDDGKGVPRLKLSSA